MQAYFNDIYPWLCVSKDDVFYYVYGLIRSEDYRAHYADNLRNKWPPMPSTEDFIIYVCVGRKLARLYPCYEKTPLYIGVLPTSCVKGLAVANAMHCRTMESVNNVRYPLELFLPVITVSLETMELVNHLPRMDVAPH